MQPVIRRECHALVKRRELSQMEIVSSPSPVRLSDILQKISYGQTLDQRLQGLQVFHRYLSEDDGRGFNRAALDQGAHRLLSWQLTQHLNINAVDSRFVLMILMCMELLWSPLSRDQLKTSVLEVVDVLPWLVHTWKRFPEDHSIVEILLAILRTWSKLKDSSLKSRLARSGVIECVKAEIDSGITNERRITLAMGLVKDLTFRSDPGDKKYIYEYLKNVVVYQCRSSSIQIVEAMSATLWNLAADKILAISMGGDEVIWTTLHYLWRSSTGNERITVQRNVSSVVGTIVSAVLADADEGEAQNMTKEQKWLVPGIFRVLASDKDTDYRRRCARILRCLVGSGPGRAMLVDCSQSNSLDDTIKLLSKILQNKNEDVDTRVQSCQSLQNLMCPGTDGGTEVGYDSQLGAFLWKCIADRNTVPKLFHAVTQTLSVALGQGRCKPATPEQLVPLFEQWNIVLHEHPREHGFHNSLSNLSVQIFDQFRNCDSLPSYVSTPFIECLRLFLEPIGPDFEPSRTNAIKVISSLTSNAATTKLLVENELLLTALVNFCLISSGRLKDDAKAAVLALIPEL